MFGLNRKDKGRGGDDGQAAQLALFGLLAALAAAISLYPRLRSISPRDLVYLGVLGAAVGGVLVMFLWRRRVAQRILKVLHEVELEGRRSGEKPKLKKLHREGPHVWRLGLRLPAGWSSLALLKIQPALEEHLDASVSVSYEGGLAWLRVGTRKLPKRVGFASFHREAGRHGPAGELPLRIGISREGPTVADLARIPHLLVGGTSQSGKSTCLRQLLVGLVQDRDPSRLRLVLADLKGGMEFNSFRELPHLLAPVARNVQMFFQAMEVVFAELKRREDLFFGAGAEDLQRWNDEHADQRMPYLVVIVDELAELTAKTSSKQEDGLRQAAVAVIAQIARMGRAVGIHLVLCTQRPDAEVVPGQIKSNLDGKLVFRAADAVHSGVMLGQGNPMAALLPDDVPGRAIWLWNNDGLHVQVPYLDKREAERMLKALPAGGGAVIGEREPSTPRPPAPPEAPLMLPKPEPPSPGASSVNRFAVDRLKVGNRYRFELADGSSVSGVLRSLSYPSGRPGNEDGQHTIWVTEGSTERLLSPQQVVGARRNKAAEAA